MHFHDSGTPFHEIDLGKWGSTRKRAKHGKQGRILLMQRYVEYVIGDATCPPPGRVVVAHVCNDVGAWGRGFVVAITKRWGSAPRKRFQSWYQAGHDKETGHNFELGKVQFVDVGHGITVANIIGQHGIYSKGGIPPVRYDAIREGLGRVAGFAWCNQASVHMPRLGCGLAGGDWESVGVIVQEELADKGVRTFVYDLPERNNFKRGD